MATNRHIEYFNSTKYKSICLLILFAILSTPNINGQNRQALVVGISDYPSTTQWNKIHGENDAELIANTLSAQGFSVVKICSKKATAKNVRKELTRLCGQSRTGNYIYIHFSCHGQPVEDVDGDESDGWDESVALYDAQMTYVKDTYEGENHITDDELHTFIQMMRKAVGANGFVCVVIDACHAGNSSRGEDDDIYVRGTKKAFSPSGKVYRPRINAQGNFYIKTESGQSPIVILEACRSYQSNYEILQDGKYYGPLSYYVSQTISNLGVTPNIEWVLAIKQAMDADQRLSRQNMVYEKSLTQ